MNPWTSSLLDLLRVIAAVAVFASHCNRPWFSKTGGWLGMIPAHEAVIVFFVLSGYVISYTTLNNARSWQQYVAARLSRLYAVIIPALVLTAVLVALGHRVSSAYYAQFDRGHEAVRIFLCAVFAQESWFMSSSPPTNAPLWSLSYEFFYYAIFGAAVFVPTRMGKAAAVVGICVLCGPKILLLFPSWAFGALAYAATHASAAARRKVAIWSLPAAIAATVVFLRFPSTTERFGVAPWFYSGSFLRDGILGLILAVAIFLASQVLDSSAPPRWLSVSVKRAAGVTFSMYLFHMPLLIFAGGLGLYDKSSPSQVIAMALGVLSVVIVLGLFFENRTLLRQLNRRCEEAIGWSVRQLNGRWNRVRVEVSEG